MSEHFLTEIEIKEFKCFKDFKAAGFKRVNLIGGKNNIGKTAFMEACYINVHSTAVSLMITAIYSVKFNRERLNVPNKYLEYEKRMELLDLIKIYHTKSNLRLAKFNINEKEVTKNYEILIDDKELFIDSKDTRVFFGLIENIYFMDVIGWSSELISSSFQSIQRNDKENELNSFIKEFDNRIETFKVIGDKPQCKTNGEYRDITEFGDGLKHYISIICALYACENGYLFIDEIDNGIHYTQLDRLWDLILKLSKQTNCQVFATTHSKEMLESFVRKAKELNDENISYTTLIKNDKQEIKAINQDYEMLIYSLSQEHEVR